MEIGTLRAERRRSIGMLAWILMAYLFGMIIGGTFVFLMICVYRVAFVCK